MCWSHKGGDLSRSLNISDNHIVECNKTFELRQILAFSMEGFEKTRDSNGQS